MIDTSQIAGHGVDADPSRRPGFPKERRRGADLTQRDIPQQKSDVKVFVNERPYKSLTPVFGTAQPPQGLAGKVRGLAYGYPAHWTRHWLLLLFADRVDVWEHRLRRPGGVAALAALGLLGTFAWRARGKRRRRLARPASDIAIVPT